MSKRRAETLENDHLLQRPPQARKMAAEPATATIQANGMKVPQWLMATAYTSLLAAGVLFATRRRRARTA